MQYVVLIAAGCWWLLSAAVFVNLLASPPLPLRKPSAEHEPLPEPLPPEPLPPEPLPHEPLPTVSVIVAARDEGARIEQTLRWLLAQQNVALDLTVVDDRSTDATPQILDRLAAEFDRLHVLHIESLPDGWLGKCHALWRGAEHARGEWILLADADIHMAPDLVGRAIATARAERADHLCLWPAINCSGAATRGVMLAWSQCLALYAPAWQINRDRGHRAIGIGAFNLVRREAYRAIGGHEPLRLEVVEDAKLGLLLRRAGFRQRIYTGLADLEAEWALSLAGSVRAVEKNWFAALHYSIAKSALVILFVAALIGVSIAAPWLAPPPIGWIGLASLWAPAIPGVIQLRRARWPAWVLPLVPLGFLLFCWAGVHSTTKTLRQGGIRWRDTFYTLAELRRGMVR
ncbi:MAG TPA: glycosyltransferase family 2 protein [Pirellulales bacterium]|jgi:glycosyltransferase involved in cell wall biosynthesis|nr:glycosyltransferase family 2 protein [Pirellulales bacterium]